ncbi:MAG: c-type cytochrome [Alphaproteobacteria bacterium]
MNNKPHLGGVAAVAFSLIVGIGASAQAQDAPPGAIEYRQTVMKTLAGHLGALGAIAKGEVSNTGHAPGHAAAIVSITEMLPDLFAAGTGPDSGVKTRATAAIWQETDKFQQIIDRSMAEAQKLVEVAQAGDPGAIGAQLGALGKNGCGACHTGFRSQ